MHDQILALPKLNKIELTFVLYPKTKRLCDLENVCSIHTKFLQDALVEYGIIPEDNYNYVSMVTYKFGSIDKEFPRVEVLIKELPNMKITLTYAEAIEMLRGTNAIFEVADELIIEGFGTTEKEVEVQAKEDKPTTTTEPVRAKRKRRSKAEIEAEKNASNASVETEPTSNDEELEIDDEGTESEVSSLIETPSLFEKQQREMIEEICAEDEEELETEASEPFIINFDRSGSTPEVEEEEEDYLDMTKPLFNF